MQKLAFLFSGQGDQYPGMGKTLVEKYAAAREIFSLCDKLRPGTSAQCFSGTEEELTMTRNTQPCLYALELAAASVLSEAGFRPDALAGYSLGEVAAAAVSGIVDVETGFRLVCRRGELMQKTAAQFDATMVAVLKLSPEQLTQLCMSFQNIYPVNFNCPGQISVSGLKAEIPEFSAAVRQAGGRVIPLNVGGPFHSPFLSDAAAAFRAELDKICFRPTQIPLYANSTAEPYTANAAELLAQQICRPVLWEQTIRNMIRDGINTFIELGPGRTLTNMVRKIDSTVRSATFDEYMMEEKPC